MVGMRLGLLDLRYLGYDFSRDTFSLIEHSYLLTRHIYLRYPAKHKLARGKLLDADIVRERLQKVSNLLAVYLNKSQFYGELHVGRGLRDARK